MATPMTPASVHKQYDEGMTAFRRQIADPAARVAFGLEADTFMRQCACGVWHHDQQTTSPNHVEYYNAIYSKGNPVPTVLYWELASSISSYTGFVLPNFFRRLVQADLEHGKSQSRRFVDTFILMLLLFAAVDGKVSESEAGFVNACADSMSLYCDKAGVSGGKADLDVNDFVTKRTDGSPVPTGKPTDEKPTEAKSEEEAAPEPEKLEDVLAELDALCGLDKVKEDVKSLINLVKVRKLRQEAGLPVPPMSLHMVFLGNPGTGKTTVARLLARIYHSIGVLSKGQLVEVDRSGLVAGFVGQTALKAQEVIDKAIGGVLFIDEAYALTNQESPNDFGQEAVEVILKNMEDHRDDLVVIVAGYDDLMEENADLISFKDVVSFQTDIREDRDEIKRQNAQGEMVSYNPPRYNYQYDFKVVIQVNHPYFDDIRIQLNNSTIELESEADFRRSTGGIGQFLTGRQFDPSYNPMYREFAMMCQELEEIFRQGQNGVPQEAPVATQVQPAPAAPAGPKFCPNCGAPADGGKFCQSCGSALQ